MSSNLILSKLDQELIKSQEASNSGFPKKEPNSELKYRSPALFSQFSLFPEEEKEEEGEEEGEIERSKNLQSDGNSMTGKFFLNELNETSTNKNLNFSPIEPSSSTIPSTHSNASDSDVLLIPINRTSGHRSKSQDSSQETRRRSSEFSSSQEGPKKKRRQSSDPSHEDGKKRKKKPLQNTLITSFFGK